MVRARAAPNHSCHGGEVMTRICHIMTADLWAGAEVQLATTMSYLAGRQDVDVRAVLFNDGRLADELRQINVDVTVMDEAQHNSLELVLMLSRFLIEHRINLVHTHRYKDTVLGVVAAKIAGVPRIVRTMHGLREPMAGWNRLKFGIYETLDNMVLRTFADRVIAVSNRMNGALVANGVTSARVTTIHNGIDLRSITVGRGSEEIRRELGVDANAIVIGTAGRLVPVKGQNTFLHAAKLILDKVPNARFVIAGDGPLEHDLKALATRLGIDHACVFLGARGDIHDVMNAMDVFVLPSLNEGLPMAVLEAMALAKPVVVSNVGGLPEVIRHRESGLLVPPGVDHAIAGACLELARDRDRASRIGAEAKRVVEDEFSHEHNGRALVDLYQAIEGRQARGSGVIAVAAAFARKVFEYGARKIDHAMERRQVNRLRRSPSAVVQALKAGHQILVVCHGNIIRSAFAAFLLEQSLGRDPRVSIVSAGLGALPGRPAHPTALRKAAERGIDLSSHAASRIERGVVAKSDVIFVMDVAQLLDLRRRFPEARAKTFLLTSLAPETPLEIRDPVNGDESVFHACFDHITRAVRPLAGVLTQS
jgi:glycosyltransferase involved in cell wall biosynthesis/protein-tyrosine-phosphatase